jgi:hypothetical protein
MRDFSLTPKPSGRASHRKANRTSKPLRYYVQRRAGDDYRMLARFDGPTKAPVAWDELDPKDDLRSRFTVLTVPARLASLKVHAGRLQETPCRTRPAGRGKFLRRCCRRPETVLRDEDPRAPSRIQRRSESLRWTLMHLA